MLTRVRPRLRSLNLAASLSLAYSIDLQRLRLLPPTTANFPELLLPELRALSLTVSTQDVVLLLENSYY